MTSNEMWENVLVTYDALFSQSAPGYEDPESSIILNKAIWYYILQRMNPRSNRIMAGFEETEFRIQELAPLVEDSNNAADPPTTTGVSQAAALPGEVLWALPSNFMLAIYEGVTTDVPVCGTSTYKRIPVVTISHDEYNLNYSNPYRGPYCNGTEGVVWRLENKPQIVNLVERKIHGIITKDFSVTNYSLRYLRFPTSVVVDFTTPSNQVNCDLPVIAHQGIVDIAVKLLSAAVRDNIPINQLTAEVLE